MSSKRRTKADGDRSVQRKPGRPRAERIFYIAVEGESTEPDYLNYLNKRFGQEHQFSIKPLFDRNGMKPREVVAKVAVYVAEIDGENQLWAMFDRDQHIGIPEAFVEAERAGIRVAYSNPSFDLWVLLHLADFGGAQSGSSVVVHEKLRQHAAFRTFDKPSKRLDADRLEAMRDHRGAAARAARLVNACSTDGCSKRGHVSHCKRMDRDPCTEVGDLLAALKII